MIRFGTRKNTDVRKLEFVFLVSGCIRNLDCYLIDLICYMEAVLLSGKRKEEIDAFQVLSYCLVLFNVFFFQFCSVYIHQVSVKFH